MSIEPITRLQRFLRVLADSSADMPEPLRNLEKCCCYACGHLDTRPELHTTLEKLIASVRDKSIVPPKPNTRLEKYVAAMAGVWDDELPEPITREDKILFEAASGEDVTLSGNPLILENCIGGKALKALHVYGKSTQDGTPTPDAPVPIVSAGDGGSVTVKVTGANVLEGTKLENTSTSNGVNFTANKNGITVVGKSNDGAVGRFYLHNDTKTKLTPGVYYLTAVGLSNSVYVNFYYVGKIYKDVQNQEIHITTDKEYSAVLSITGGLTLNTTVQVSLTRNKVTAYSPYCEQLLTLPTHNGLPGIPVTSGGNYTDPSGQQWVCDEVDLEREVRVQRIGKAEITSTYRLIISTSKLDTGGINKVQPFRIRDIYTIPGTTVICTTLPGVKNIEPWGQPYECIGGVGSPAANIDFHVANERLGTTAETTSDDALEALRNWLKTNPLSFIYALVTPVETPLTDAEIAAYKSLTTYAPTTGLQATDGAGLEATYKCNVRKAEKTINDLYAELTAELEA